MKVYFRNISYLSILIATLASCSQSKTIRFEASDDVNALKAYKAQSNHVPILEKNDIIEITLISSNEKFTKLFSTAVENNIRNQLTYTSGASALKGFLVDQQGFLEVPYAGKIQAHNRSREEVKNEITEKLKVFITEPIVQLKILNFKITVLGDVQRPGTFNIPNEKISFIEALGIAGDVNITANINEVIIYREINDTLTKAALNLNTEEVFYSDYFMLKQNDIIYIPPNKAKSATARYSPIYIPLLTSISLLLTTLNLLIP
jgi:polysaccharide biosynthesis/export protein